MNKKEFKIKLQSGIIYKDYVFFWCHMIDSRTTPLLTYGPEHFGKAYADHKNERLYVIFGGNYYIFEFVMGQLKYIIDCYKSHLFEDITALLIDSLTQAQAA